MTILREHRHRIVGAPLVAEPAVAPVQPAAEPVEVEDATAAVRVAEHASSEEDAGQISVRLLLPFLRMQVRVLPERLEDAGIQQDVLGRPETPQELLAFDPLLAFTQTGLEAGLGDVDLGEREAAGILLDLAREAVAVCGATPEAPSLTDERGGVEGLGAVDLDYRRLADDNPRAVIDEGGDLRLTRVFDDPLGGFRIHPAPVDVIRKCLYDTVRLTCADRLTHDVAPCSDALTRFLYMQ